MGLRIGAGAIAGLLAGLVFGMMMHMMMVPAPEGGDMPMMAMIGKIIGSPTVTAGWAYHLFNSAVFGAIFGWLFGERALMLSPALGWGVLYGFVWWILGSLILMPLLLGMPAFAPLMMPPMRMVAMGSLVGHLIYGLVLGGSFPVFARRSVRATV